MSLRFVYHLVFCLVRGLILLICVAAASPFLFVKPIKMFQLVLADLRY